MSPIASGLRRHPVVLQGITTTPNSDGGFDEAYTTLVPEWRASIEAASQRQLERVASGTVISEATHVLTGPYVPGVTTKSRAILGSQVFHVLGVNDPRLEHRELILTCLEVVD